MWRSDDDSSSCRVQDATQVIKLGAKHLYSLGHYIIPRQRIFKLFLTFENIINISDHSYILSSKVRILHC